MLMRRKPKEIIKKLKEHNLDVARTAQELGLHRSTVYRWKKRAAQHGRAELRIRGVERTSTRPKNIHTVLTQTEKTYIIETRKKTKATAEKITRMLELNVSWRTVHRYMKKVGLVRECGYHRRPRFQDTRHMHAKNTKTIGYLQMDVKHVTPELSGLPWTCYEYAVIDIFSRYKDAVILNQLDQSGSIVALLGILPRLPFTPVFIQTDNGLEFQQRFRDFCTAQGMEYHHIHKSAPNENAIIERSFRTDEEEFYFRLPKRPQHYDELREQLAQYLHYYNHERLHLGIDLQTPYQVVANVVSD